MSRKRTIFLICCGLLFPGLLLFSNVSVMNLDDAEELRFTRKLGELRSKFEHLEMIMTNRRVEQFLARASLSNSTSHSALMHGSGSSYLNFPSLFHYLPHLTKNLNSTQIKVLSPVQPGSRRLATLVFGIPTVKRDGQSYLLSTLDNLFSNTPPEDLLDCLFIVFIAETDEQIVESIDVEIKKQFSAQLEKGILQVVAPSEGYYPDWSKLRITLDDPIERVKWRTKQNLDYAFLMMVAQTQGVYYVQLEDDVLSMQDYVKRIRDYAFEQEKGNRSWFVSEFCQLGFIGKMFHSSDLTYMVQYFAMFHNDRPADWLIEPLFETRFCPVDAKKCREVKKKMWLRYKPSLFQHVGTVSSLKGKVQKLKDKSFGKLPLFVQHKNPSAKVSTVIKPYKKHTLENAYSGVTFFWGLSPQLGDQMSIKFSSPLKLSRFRIRSGNPEHPSDLLYNTTVELNAERQGVVDLPTTSDGFIVIGEFDVRGIAEGNIPETIGDVSDLRLTIHSESKNWVIISELLVEKR